MRIVCGIVIGAGEVIVVQILTDDSCTPVRAISRQRSFGNLLIVPEDLDHNRLRVHGGTVVLPLLGDVKLQIVAVEQIVHGEVVEEIAPARTGVGVGICPYGDIIVQIRRFNDIVLDGGNLGLLLVGFTRPPAVTFFNREVPPGFMSPVVITSDGNLIQACRLNVKDDLCLRLYIIERDLIVDQVQPIGHADIFRSIRSEGNGLRHGIFGVRVIVI